MDDEVPKKTDHDDKTRILKPKGTPENSNLDNQTVIQPRKRPRTNSSIEPLDDTESVDDKTKLAPKRQQATKVQPNTRQSSRANPLPSQGGVKGSAETSSLSQEDLLNPNAGERIINRRFVLKESLGVGGMGMVFRALDLRKEETGDNEPYIAIKILTSEFNEHPQAFVSLQREAKKSQLLSHPNIIKVYDFDRDGDLVYLTMEELKGKPLDRLIKDNPGGLPLELALNVIRGISSGLAYAHQKNVVHADLKPENVFVTKEGEVKLIDFGIARILTQLDEEGNYIRQYDDDEIVGLTPAYASLEMLNHKAAIPSDDLYALGAICYEVLTGDHPFLKLSAKEAFKENKTVSKLKQLKGYQWKAIAKALSFEQDKRFKNATEFHDQFTAKGRTVRNLSIGLVVVSIILAISISIPRGQNTDHLYDELAEDQRLKFDELIKEGDTLRGFGDLNNALSFYDQAYKILPQHSITQESLSLTVSNIIEQLEGASPALSKKEKLLFISELQKYQSLAEHPELAEYKERVALDSK